MSEYRDSSSNNLLSLISGAFIGAAGLAWWLISEADKRKEEKKQKAMMYSSRIQDGSEAIDKIKTKTKDEPINIFNEAINNIKPTVEVRSRRVGGATYQVPVEVKSKRSQALALRWLVDASRKRKDKKMSDKIFNEIYDAYQNRGSAIKKKEDTHKMAESNKAFAHFRW